MNHKRTSLFFLFIAIFLLGSSIDAVAQTAPNSSGAFEEIFDVPVDTALYLLMLAGSGVGLKKMLSNNRKK
jgi:hypothetical protein